MARPRTLPEENSELERLLRRHTMQDIADMYDVTVQAVSKAVKDRKIPYESRISYKQYIPWRIKTEHSGTHYLHRMLQLYARDSSGKPLTVKHQQMLRRFKDRCEELDAVVQYDPDHEKGPWLLVPRREGIDTGYVRNPEVP